MASWRKVYYEDGVRAVRASFLLRLSSPELARLEIGSVLRFHLGLAGGTKRGFAEVDPFDGVAGGHGAAVVLAVTEIESVTEFVDGFFEEAMAEQGVVAIEAVELLVEAVGGDDGAGTSHLSFAEDVFQDGDVEIEVSDGKDAPILRADQRLHSLNDFGGMILLALGMVDLRRIECGGEDVAGHVQAARDGDAEVVEKRGIDFTDRKQVYEIHCERSTSFFARRYCAMSEARVQP